MGGSGGGAARGGSNGETGRGWYVPLRNEPSRRDASIYNNEGGKGGERGRARESEGERGREGEEFEKEISLKPNSLRARKCLSIIQFRTNDIDDVTILIGIYINVST